MHSAHNTIYGFIAGNFPNIIQATTFSNEEKLFRKSGVNSVIDPNLIMARGMLLILLKELNLPISSVSETQHTFEYKIKEKDKYVGKTPKEIEKLGFKIDAFKPAGVNKLYRDSECKKLKPSDNIILSSNFTSYRKIDGKH